MRIRWTISLLILLTQALASCSKVYECQDSDMGSMRAITITFSDDCVTRTTLGNDGLSPEWAVGDKIWLSTSQACASYTLRQADISDGKAQIRTNLTGKIVAVYPYAAVVTPGTATLTPSITISKNPTGDFADANICCATADISGTAPSLSFKNATAIIKVNITDDNVRNVVIPAAGISGEFKIDFDETIPTLSPEAKCDTIYLKASASGYYYIAAAPTTVTHGTCLEFRNALNTLEGSRRITADVKLERSKMHLCNNVEANGQVFSIGNDKKVIFAGGNLKCVGSTWGFFDKQYDMFTTITSGQSAHFCWGYSDKSVNYDDTTTNPSFTDWTGVIGGGWRTPTGGSSGEWNCIFNRKFISNNTYANFGFATITGLTNDQTAKGIILLPDCITTAPTITDGSPNKTSFNSGNNGSNYLSSDQWTNLEKLGAVFLPFTYIRSSADGKNFGISSGKQGYYWSRTPGNNSNLAYGLNFTQQEVNSKNYGTFRCYGLAVRMIKE